MSVLYCVNLGTAISKRYACFCCLFKIIYLVCYAECECQLKLSDQNIICNCHFLNNFLVYKCNVVVYPLINLNLTAKIHVYNFCEYIMTFFIFALLLNHTLLREVFFCHNLTFIRLTLKAVCVLCAL
jgi:hypothetical protein